MSYDVRVRLYLTELTNRHKPALIERRGPRTLMAWDARVSRQDIVAWMFDTLTEEEIAQVMDAYDVRFPLPDWTVSERPVMLYVPRKLRLPGDTAIQCRPEWLRRLERNDLYLESAAYRAEVVGAPAPDLDLVELLHDRMLAA